MYCSYYCSGCVKWLDSSWHSPRDQSKARDTKCLQVWQNKFFEDVPPCFEKHYIAVKTALERQQEMTIEAWQRQTLALLLSFVVDDVVCTIVSTGNTVEKFLVLETYVFYVQWQP